MENPRNFLSKIRHSTPKPDLRKKALKRSAMSHLRGSESFILLQNESFNAVDLDPNGNIPLLKQELSLPRANDHRTLSSEYRGSLPRGRCPLLLVPGLQYEITNLHTQQDEEEILTESVEDVEEGRRVRMENYEMDSFVCQNGYLSDEECFETPGADRKEKRIRLVKTKAASEKKRLKRTLSALVNPEVIGPLYSTNAGGVRAQFKKWRPLTFQTRPIQTGVSVGLDLLRQGRLVINATNHGSELDVTDDHLRHLHLLEHALQDQPLLLDQILHRPLTLKQKQFVEDQEVVVDEPVLPNLLPQLPLPQPDHHQHQAPALHSSTSKDIVDSCTDYATKYFIKYKVKHIVYATLTGEAGSWNAEQLLDLVYEQLRKHVKGPEVRKDKGLVWRYVNKYLAKFKYSTSGTAARTTLKSRTAR